ncbi:MAG: FtsQ-type POTRA domain-containing protein [Actinomycetes bacterium]|nr:FtsQ-type POTRA domain-containing protein [Actinomycetes bacterium]
MTDDARNGTSPDPPLRLRMERRPRIQLPPTYGTPRISNTTELDNLDAGEYAANPSPARRQPDVGTPSGSRRNARRSAVSGGTGGRSEQANQGTGDWDWDWDWGPDDDADDTDAPSTRAQRTGRARRARRGTSGRELSDAELRTQQKRRERERRHRERSLRRVAFVVAIVLVLAGLVWGVVALINAPLFEVRTVGVIGANRVEAAEIRRLASIKDGQSVITLDSDALIARVKADPWVASVEVKKRLLHTIQLTITERSPLLLVQMGTDNRWLLASDGIWLGSVDATAATISDPNGKYTPLSLDTTVTGKGKKKKETAVLPWIALSDVPVLQPVAGKHVSDEVIENALDVITGMSDELRAIIKEGKAPDIVQTTFYTTEGIELDIGSAEGIADKDRIIRQVLAEQSGVVVLINVRTVEKPTWRGLNGD